VVREEQTMETTTKTTTQINYGIKFTKTGNCYPMTETHARTYANFQPGVVLVKQTVTTSEWEETS
jgi:hypothetical protein